MATERAVERGKVTKIEISEDLVAEAVNLYVLAMSTLKKLGVEKIEEQTGDDPFEMKTKVSIEGPAEAVEVYTTMWDYSHALKEMGEPEKPINMGQYMRQAVMDVLGITQKNVAAKGGVSIKAVSDVKIDGDFSGRKKVNRREVGSEGEEIKTDLGYIDLESGKQIMLQKLTRVTWAPWLDFSGVKVEASDQEIEPGVRLMRRVSVEDGEQVVRLVRYQAVEANAVVADLKKVDVLQWLA